MVWWAGEAGGQGGAEPEQQQQQQQQPLNLVFPHLCVCVVKRMFERCLVLVLLLFGSMVVAGNCCSLFVLFCFVLDGHSTCSNVVVVVVD